MTRYIFAAYLRIYLFYIFLSKSWWVLGAIHEVHTQVGGGSQSKNLQTNTGGVMECEYTVWLSFFCFFSLWSVQILQTLRVKIYTNRFLSILRFILPSLVSFPELHRCCIRLQVFKAIKAICKFSKLSK